MYKSFVCPAERLEEELKQCKGYKVHSVTYVGQDRVLVLLEKAK